MDISRRDFTKMLAVGGAMGACGCSTFRAGGKNEHDFMWSYLIHLGTNTMCDRVPSSWGLFKKEQLSGFGPSKKLRCDDNIWRETIDAHAAAGTNTIVIGLAEGVVYPSHPELAVEGSWSVEKLRGEIARMRSMGLEVLPKLNFSATHDIWMQDYSRMLSTKKYYQVCEDLIRDVDEIFDHPRMIHLGYDEENWENQCKYDFAVIRQGDLWWHDFLWFVKTAEKYGMRSWIWTDCNRKNPEVFYKRMPRDVIQSNWYYGLNFADRSEKIGNADRSKKRLQYYIDFDKAGFEQIPCGSNWYNDGNFPQLSRFCRGKLSKRTLRGMLMAPWFKTMPENRGKLLSAAKEVQEAIKG